MTRLILLLLQLLIIGLGAWYVKSGRLHDRLSAPRGDRTDSLRSTLGSQRFVFAIIAGAVVLLATLVIAPLGSALNSDAAAVAVPLVLAVLVIVPFVVRRLRSRD